eukprot:scaffold1342_cov204-Pinguiococcus_pyrenoidosus.AAC.16
MAQRAGRDHARTRQARRAGQAGVKGWRRHRADRTFILPAAIAAVARLAGQLSDASGLCAVLWDCEVPDGDLRGGGASIGAVQGDASAR